LKTAFANTTKVAKGDSLMFTSRAPAPLPASNTNAQGFMQGQNPSLAQRQIIQIVSDYAATASRSSTSTASPDMLPEQATEQGIYFRGGDFPTEHLKTLQQHIAALDGAASSRFIGDLATEEQAAYKKTQTALKGKLDENYEQLSSAVKMLNEGGIGPYRLTYTSAKGKLDTVKETASKIQVLSSYIMDLLQSPKDAEAIEKRDGVK
jgi:hypothetical protein